MMKPGIPLLLLGLLCCQCGPSEPGEQEAGSVFRFIQLSDTHVGKSPQEEENLRHAVAQINQTDAAFVLLTGDLTDHGRIDEYEVLKDALSGLAIPYHCVPGDNDIIDGEGDLDRYREALGPEYYRFDFKGFRFIGVDNNSWLSLDEAQRVWLDEELDGERPAVVFAHRPLLDKNRGFEPFRLAEPLMNLFASRGVLLYLSGDAHEPAEVLVDGTYHIWCDNLSFFHTGRETYNFFEIGPDRFRLYHVHFDGTREFVLAFP